MIEVLDLHRHKVNRYEGEDFTSVEFHKDGVIGWIKLNYDDFYKWLKATNFHYYNQLRWKHFFFDKYSLNEDFADKKNHERCVEVLNSYLSDCDSYKPILDVSQRIDLSHCLPCIQRLHHKLFSWANGCNLADNSLNPLDYGLPEGTVNFFPAVEVRRNLLALGFSEDNVYCSQTFAFNRNPDNYYAKVSILYSFCDSSRKQELLDAYYKKHPQPEIVYDDKENSTNLSNEKPVNS